MKEFTIEGLTLTQDKCAMKIGTDGVLLGRWVDIKPESPIVNHKSPIINALDIGTGTGLLALLLAVRFPETRVTAIDIDEGAYLQAKENVERNGMQDRVEVIQTSLQDFNPAVCVAYNDKDGEGFDVIICNPPYFKNSLKSPDVQRNLARHTDSLSFHDLLHHAARLLSSSGKVSMIIPAEAKTEVDYEAVLAGLFPSRITAVKTTPRKPVKRYLLEFSKKPCEIEVSEHVINPETNN